MKSLTFHFMDQRRRPKVLFGPNMCLPTITATVQGEASSGRQVDVLSLNLLIIILLTKIVYNICYYKYLNCQCIFYNSHSKFIVYKFQKKDSNYKQWSKEKITEFVW